MFYEALVRLVRNGLTDEDPALHGAYLNAYQVRRTRPLFESSSMFVIRWSL